MLPARCSFSNSSEKLSPLQIRGSPEIGNVFINYPGAGTQKDKIPQQCHIMHFMKKAIQGNLSDKLLL